MQFEGDAFISYAHMDNVELVEGRKGWVANLHRALEVRLGQLMGKPPQIWRDPKLSGNDVLAETLIEKIRRVVALVSVISPRYVKSEWTRKELSEFYHAAEQQGLQMRDKARIFKVLKTPVPVELHPPELRSLLGYEFYKIDPETGRVRELDEVFGPEAQRDFWIRLDDLAHDICCVLEMLQEAEQRTSVNGYGEGQYVFLAETASDMREQREVVKRDLERHGHTVLPAYNLPLVRAELEGMIRNDLKRCSMSIHLVGKSYGVVPEGAMQSLIEIQNELAVEREQQGGFSRLLWIPTGLQVEDERQSRVIEQLRMDPRFQDQTDLIESSLEDLRTVYQEKLQRGTESKRTTEVAVSAAPTVNRLYLMYDQRDEAAVAPYTDYLFEQKFETITPVFEGDEAELREYHEENLRSCDGALIFYGSVNECWVRRKLREVQKSVGFGRTKPPAGVGIVVLPSPAQDSDSLWCSPSKKQFRTHEAMLISQLDGFAPEQLWPLLNRLTGAGDARRGHGK